MSCPVTILPTRGRPIPALDDDYPDVALLEVSGLASHPCVRIDLGWPDAGDACQAFGFPEEGRNVQLTPAWLVYRGTKGVQPTAFLDLGSDTIRPGMSGAPVLNRRTGRVCGIIVASRHTARPDGALAVPCPTIAADITGVLAANEAFHRADRRWEEAAGIPSYRTEVIAYLRVLTDWLNADSWPQDLRFNGPVLIPSAIERTLGVSVKGRAGEQIISADDVAQRCTRLVVLGEPRSGKTWLAKRTARRCAEAALAKLEAGGTLEEVELPLYTTCSRLLSVDSAIRNVDGDIRKAAVVSALDQLGGLGGARMRSALREVFAEQDEPTLLVIDSLDEAQDPENRLSHVGKLRWLSS